MHDILKSLWRGNLTPRDRFVREDSEYKHLTQLKDKLLKQLLAELSDEAKDCFQKIEDLNNEMQFLSEEETFITGFQLGARIMLDVLNEHSEQFDT